MSDNEVNSKKTLNLCRRGYKNIEKITLSSTSYQEKRQNLPILNIGKCICNICDKAFNQSGIYITMGHVTLGHITNAISTATTYF